MSLDQAPPAAPDAGVCPYVGARAFEENDRDGYVGREPEVELVLNKVLAGRLTVLFGPSGVGKSSLLRAGLIPRLREVCEGGVYLVYRDVWIEGNYLEQLQTSVADYARISRDIASEDPMPVLLLVFDGFEQLLARSTPDEVRALIQYLAQLVHGNLDVRVAISLRAEFLARLDAYRNELPELMQGRFPLRPIARAQVRRALIEPARAHGMEWDPGFADRLIADFDAVERSDELGETGPQLCFLSEVARRLWHRAQSQGRRRIEADLYRGRDDELNGILCEVFAGLDEPTLDAAARVVCRLAPPTGRKVPCTTSDLTADPGVSEAAVAPVLARLQTHHLVRLRESGGARWFELTHDTLTGFLRRWGEQRLTTMRERATLKEQRAARRARRRKLTLRAVTWSLTAVVLGGLIWYVTMDLRVATETQEQLEKLTADFLGETGESRRRLQLRRIEQVTQQLWSRHHHARERWATAWLEQADRRAPDAFLQERPERARQVGEPVNCELVVGDDKNVRFLDFAWRAASPMLRRWHVPVTERVPACPVDYLDPGMVALSADPSATRTATRRRMRSAVFSAHGTSSESGAGTGVFEPVTLVQSLRRSLSWDSLRVNGYDEQFDEAGLSELRKHCEPAPFGVADWPAGDCALPRWARPLLDLAMVKYEPMETKYYRDRMTRVLMTEPRVIPHADTLVPVLEALRPGSDTHGLQCMADTLRQLSFEARKRNRVLPALLPLVDHLAELCAPPFEHAARQRRVAVLWTRLERSSVSDGSACPSPHSEWSDTARPDFEKLGPMLQRLAIFPGIQVHLAKDLAAPEHRPNTPHTAVRGALIDGAGRLTHELERELERMQRELYERDGIVIASLRFEKREAEFGRAAIEIVVQGACLSKAARIDFAAIPEADRARAIVSAVADAVRRELSSSFHRRELLDAVELLPSDTAAAVTRYQADMLNLLREIGAAREPQTRALVRHTSPLLSASLLLRELEPTRERWLQAVAELGARSAVAAPRSIEKEVAKALVALRAGRVSEARQLARALRTESSAARTAMAELYPEHVQRTLLAVAEQTCSKHDGDEYLPPLRSLRSQAQLSTWATRPDLALLDDTDPSRITRARLCVLRAMARRQTPYSPAERERWEFALSAIASMRVADARSGSLATALESLRRSESAAPERVPDDVQRAVVRLARIDDDVLQRSVVDTLIAEPVARWRIELALELLRTSSEFRWVERVLAWMVLERSESPVDANAVLRALVPLERVAPEERSAREFLIARAYFRLGEVERALGQFELARAGAPPWLHESIADLQAETLVHARRFDDVLRLRVGETEAERCAVRRHQSKAAIATADPSDGETVTRIRRLVEDEGCTVWDPAEQAYARAWVAVLFGAPDADQVANEYFTTGHPDADYVRLFRAGMRELVRAEDGGRDASTIRSRWQEIQEAGAPSNWAARARQGDMRVWHERLIGYWAGARSERELRDAVASEANLKREGLATLGLTLSSLRAEAYFYIGLRAAVEGRLDHAKAMWRRVESEGRPEYHEFVVARFLTRKLGAGVGAHVVAMRER